MYYTAADRHCLISTASFHVGIPILHNLYCPIDTVTTVTPLSSWVCAGVRGKRGGGNGHANSIIASKRKGRQVDLRLFFKKKKTGEK